MTEDDIQGQTIDNWLLISAYCQSSATGGCIFSPYRKEYPVDELMRRSSVEVDTNWRVSRITEKPVRTEIMSPYAASILFIFPPQIWEYLHLIKPSMRGEIEMQAAIDRMLQDGFKAFGVLQPAPLEWDPALHS